MFKKLTYLLFFILFNHSFLSAQTVTGTVYDENREPLPHATVIIEGHKLAVTTSERGRFLFDDVPAGNTEVTVSFIGYRKQTKQAKVSADLRTNLRFYMEVDDNPLSEVEVFGERYKQPEKMDVITRMPLRPSEQIQSISVISDKMIAQQGAQTVTEAVRNIPGVTLFGSYGGVRESMSIRGYRGVPILRNGVRVDSDFRTGSALTEMQGVESVQVIKGSAAVTQGLGNDLGSAGGVINVVSKTPKFTNTGEFSLRAGSWGYVRPSFDVQAVFNKEKTVAVRLNGSFERSDHYRPVINSDRVYCNPSMEWRPDDKTAITLELDYMNDNRTPHTSTINLAADSIEALYDMPHDKFLGFDSDNANNKTFTYSVRATRKIAGHLSLRAAFFKSSYKVDNSSTSVSTVVNDEYNRRRRTVARSLRDDKNSTFQFDFIGQDLYTGPLKHTFQAGFDFKTTDLSTTSYTSAKIDTIDVTGPASEISNKLGGVTLTVSNPVESEGSSYGLLAQEVMSFKGYIKLILGIRYSHGSSIAATDAGVTTGDAWNPIFGLMVSPIKNINLFGSYTTTTSLRSASQQMRDAGGNISETGPSVTKQLEFGVKSDWLDNKLRFNFTYFDIITENIAATEYDETTLQPTGYVRKAGDLKRNGIETELSGRVLNNLEVILGYAYLDARYEGSPIYEEGSAPMNAPNHTANGWVYYTVEKSKLKGLSIGAGLYYVGKRPVNDWNLEPYGQHGAGEAIQMTGSQPFDMPEYTTINAQLAYSTGKLTVRVFLNNINDALGYNAYYRGGYINQIDPRNYAGMISWRF